jgi:hypothetical protein
MNESQPTARPQRDEIGLERNHARARSSLQGSARQATIETNRHVTDVITPQHLSASLAGIAAVLLTWPRKRETTTSTRPRPDLDRHRHLDHGPDAR